MDAGPRAGILVVLHKNFSAEDALRAYVDGWRVSDLAHEEALRLTSQYPLLSQMGSGIPESDSFMEEHFPVLLRNLTEAGWRLERVALPNAGWTAEWVHAKDD